MINLFGYFIIIFSAIFFLNSDKKYLLLNPFILILFNYFRFFGISTYKITLETELILILSFILYSFSYWLGYKFINIKKPLFLRSNSYKLENIQLKNPKYLFSLIIIYTILDIYSNYLKFNDLGIILIRFYSYYNINETSPWLDRFVSSYFYSTSIIIFIFRINLRLFNKQKIYYWFSFILITLVAIPRGSVGAIMLPLFSTFIADIVSYFYQHKITSRVKWLITPSNLFSILIIILISTIILSVRNTSYNSPQNFFDNIVSGEIYSMALDQKISGSHSVVLEDLEYCLTHFGESLTFLHFHTLNSIIVNVIPRELWNDKPFGFGLLLAEAKGYLYSGIGGNVSFAAGITGEGWANDGLFGVIYFNLIFGMLTGVSARFSRLMFTSHQLKYIGLGILLYSFSTNFVRGDMISAWAQNAYPVLIYILILFFIHRKQIL